MVLTDGNGVTQDQRRYVRGKRSRVNGFPKETTRGCGIRIATRNTWLGRAGGLETALRTLRQGKIGIGVLKETKLIGGVHTQQNSGYMVWATEAESKNRGRLPSSGGKWRDGGLRECGALDQKW